MLFAFKTIALFGLTAIAEILGCYLSLLAMKDGKSKWLFIPAIASLGLFVWLLSLHPAAAGRVYAAYGGVYVATAILWLWFVDKIQPSIWDITGVVIVLFGAAVIIVQPGLWKSDG